MITKKLAEGLVWRPCAQLGTKSSSGFRKTGDARKLQSGVCVCVYAWVCARAQARARVNVCGENGGVTDRGLCLPPRGGTKKFFFKFCLRKLELKDK